MQRKRLFLKSVESGFRKLREINTVVYDPALITPDEMVSALKATGTYLGTEAQKSGQGEVQ